ncbi:MAG: NOL1/NOP2/sun family putative RNA methylase [Gammaproteobacteria bacterium]|nr:NOL1/NOP2/sun family putative RNA methylase [Gammaproteobacteria bacterium]
MSAPLSLSAGFIDYLPQLLATNEHQAFLDACAQPPKKSIRFNRLTTSAERHGEIAAGHGWQLQPIPWCDDGYWLTGEESPGNALEHVAGGFYIQEASSMLPVAVLQRLWHQQHGPSTPARVLDMAAAPGSKTTQLGSWLAGNGTLVANEFAASRLKALYTNLSRCGVGNTILTNHDGAIIGNALPDWFDAILLDAPCSGEGTIRKDAKAFANWSLPAIHELVATQRRLLESAFKALRPGGLLVYSTCSLNTLENEQLIDRFCADHGDAERHDLRPLWPQLAAIHHPQGHLKIWPHRFDAEGFFVAALSKAADAAQQPRTEARLSPRFPYQPLSAKEQLQCRQLAADSQQLSLPEGDYWQRDGTIWLFPEAARDLLGRLLTNRPGLKIGEIHGRELRLDHDAAIVFAPLLQRRIAVNGEQARAFLAGQDIEDDAGRKGDWLLCYQGLPLGLARAAQGRLRNRLPRDRVRQTTIADHDS